jgi:hypothetical protein
MRATATAEMVSVEVAAPFPGVMIAGENAHCQPLGTPLQASVIGLLNDPDCGFAVTVTVADCPAGMVTAVGEALKVTVEVEDPPPELHAGL